MVRFDTKDLVVAPFNGEQFFIGYMDQPPFMFVGKKLSFFESQDKVKRVNEWTHSKMDKAMKDNQKFREWVLKHWNSVDMSDQPTYLFKDEIPIRHTF